MLFGPVVSAITAKIARAVMLLLANHIVKDVSTTCMNAVP